MKFLGLPYPIVKTPFGFMRTQSGIEQVKSDLLCLLMTNPGERVMLNDFGTPLRKFLFEPNDAILSGAVRDTVINSIRKWEKRVGIKSIEVTGGINSTLMNQDDRQENLDNYLTIKIAFVDFDNLQNIEELVLQLPLGNQ